MLPPMEPVFTTASPEMLIIALPPFPAVPPLPPPIPRPAGTSVPLIIPGKLFAITVPPEILISAGLASPSILEPPPIAVPPNV